MDLYSTSSTPCKYYTTIKSSISITWSNTKSNDQKVTATQLTPPLSNGSDSHYNIDSQVAVHYHVDDDSGNNCENEKDDDDNIHDNDDNFPRFLRLRRATSRWQVPPPPPQPLHRPTTAWTITEVITFALLGILHIVYCIITVKKWDKKLARILGILRMLCESHLLRLYFSVFQPLVASYNEIVSHLHTHHTVFPRTQCTPGFSLTFWIEPLTLYNLGFPHQRDPWQGPGYPFARWSHFFWRVGTSRKSFSLKFKREMK